MFVFLTHAPVSLFPFSLSLCTSWTLFIFKLFFQRIKVQALNNHCTIFRHQTTQLAPYSKQSCCWNSSRISKSFAMCSPCKITRTFIHTFIFDRLFVRSFPLAIQLNCWSFCELNLIAPQKKLKFIYNINNQKNGIKSLCHH